MENYEIVILFLIGILFIFVVAIMNEINIDEQNKFKNFFMMIGQYEDGGYIYWLICLLVSMMTVAQ
jgi:hypothetical protein